MKKSELFGILLKNTLEARFDIDPEPYSARIEQLLAQTDDPAIDYLIDFTMFRNIKRGGWGIDELDTLERETFYDYLKVKITGTQDESHHPSNHDTLAKLIASGFKCPQYDYIAICGLKTLVG